MTSLSPKFTRTRFVLPLHPVGGAYNASPDSLVGWGGVRGDILQHTFPLDAFGVSISATTAPRFLCTSR